MDHEKDTAFYPPVDAVTTGLRGRCPRCGQGQLFDGLLAVKSRCMNCDLDNSFVDSGDGPAVFVIMIIGFVVVGLALAVEVNFQPPMLLHFALWIPLTIILSLVLLRALKGILIALQYKNNAHEGELVSNSTRSNETGGPDA